MKVAVLGAGQWGQNLVKTFHALGALGAVVESDAARRDAGAAQTPGVPWLEKFEDLDPAISAVAIATPAPTHYAVASAALAAGKDVFVEKPITLNTEDARKLVDQAEKAGRVLMTGHLLLYQPAVRWISSFVREGGVGKLLSIHQERLNLGRARAVENVLWSLGVHDVAVLLDLVGAAPQSVVAVGQKALQAKIDDDFYLHLKFPEGVQAHLHVSWLWPERRRRTTVVGDKAMLVYDELAQTVHLHRKRIEVPTLQNEDGGAEEVFRAASQEPLKLELEHFLARCADRQVPLSGPAHALQVIQILEAAG